MRAQTALLVLQTLGLAALAVLVLRAPAPPPTETESAVFTSVATPIDEARLRRIIREEMQALAMSQPAGSAISAPALVPSRDRAADRDQRDYVEQQFAYLTSVGTASRSDMQHLEDSIAKLSPADRREMLNRLARAVNSGRIKGHL